MHNKTSDLANMIRSGAFVVAPSCTDALSARIIERLGFPAVYLGGFSYGAASCVSEPLTTMTEIVDMSAHIAHRIDVPLLIDGGAGFGEPLHTMRMIQELEWAGVSGVHIEDQHFPKRASYHRDYQEEVVTEGEFLDKLRMAIRARTDDTFLIMARTDAMKTHNYREGIRRANAALDIGADMAFGFPNDLEEAKSMPSDVAGPTIYVNSWGNRVGRPILSTEDAISYGYSMLIEAVSGVLVLYKAITDLFSHLRDDGICNLDSSEAVQLRRDLEEVVGLPAMYDVENETVEARK